MLAFHDSRAEELAQALTRTMGARVVCTSMRLPGIGALFGGLKRSCNVREYADLGSDRFWRSRDLSATRINRKPPDLRLRSKERLRRDGFTARIRAGLLDKHAEELGVRRDLQLVIEATPVDSLGAGGNVEQACG